VKVEVNLTYWDKHKLASMLSMILILVFYAIYFGVTSPMEDRAWERAADRLSHDEAQAVNKYFDYYERYLPSQYQGLDSISTGILLIGIVAAIYSGFTALHIPERYQKKEQEPINEN